MDAPLTMKTILESDVTTVKKWKSIFEAAGILTVIVPTDLKKSWKPRLMLAVADTQLKKAKSLLDEDFQDSLSEREKEIN